jgi:hypothetical protein
MASVLTNYFGGLVLQHYLRDNPSWLALFTADPTVTGSLVNEVTGGSYARLSAVWSAPGSKSTGLGALRFLNMPACTVTHFAVADALSGGNLLLISALPVAISVVDSAEVRVPTNAIVVTL